MTRYGLLMDEAGVDAAVIHPPGWEGELPSHPTLGDVDSPAALASYQATKRALKAEIRAAKG